MPSKTQPTDETSHPTDGDSSSSSAAVRMMVLETDEPHQETRDRKGAFGHILHEHFAAAGRAHDPPLQIQTDRRFVVTPKGGRMPTRADFDGYHALLITGSMYDAHGDDGWILELLGLLRGALIYLDYYPTTHHGGLSPETGARC